MRFPLARRQRRALLSRTSAQGWAVRAKSVAMQPVSPEVWATFERRLDEARVPAPQRPDYCKWVCFYFDFCHLVQQEILRLCRRTPEV